MEKAVVNSSDLLVEDVYDLLENDPIEAFKSEIENLNQLVFKLEEIIELYGSTENIPDDFNGLAEIVSLLGQKRDSIDDANINNAIKGIDILSRRPGKNEIVIQRLNEILFVFSVNPKFEDIYLQIKLSILKSNTKYQELFGTKNRLSISQLRSPAQLRRKLITISDTLKSAGINLDELNTTFDSLPKQYSIFEKSDRMLFLLKQVIDQLGDAKRQSITDQLYGFVEQLVETQTSMLVENSIADLTKQIAQPSPEVGSIDNRSLESNLTTQESDAKALPGIERVGNLLAELIDNKLYIPFFRVLLTHRYFDSASKTELFLVDYIVNESVLINKINSQTTVNELCEIAQKLNISNTYNSLFGSGTVLNGRFGRELKVLNKILRVHNLPTIFWIWLVNRIHAFNTGVDINESILGTYLNSKGEELKFLKITLSPIEPEVSEQGLKSGDTVKHRISLNSEYEPRIKSLKDSFSDNGALSPFVVNLLDSIQRLKYPHCIENLLKEHIVPIVKSKVLTMDMSFDLLLRLSFIKTDSELGAPLSNFLTRLNDLILAKYPSLNTAIDEITKIDLSLTSNRAINKPTAFNLLILNSIHSEIYGSKLGESLLEKLGLIDSDLLSIDGFSGDEAISQSSDSVHESLLLDSSDGDSNLVSAIVRSKDTNRDNSSVVRVTTKVLNPPPLRPEDYGSGEKILSETSPLKDILNALELAAGLSDYPIYGTLYQYLRQGSGHADAFTTKLLTKFGGNMEGLKANNITILSNLISAIKTNPDLRKELILMIVTKKSKNVRAGILSSYSSLLSVLRKYKFINYGYALKPEMANSCHMLAVYLAYCIKYKEGVNFKPFLAKINGVKIEKSFETKEQEFALKYQKANYKRLLIRHYLDQKPAYAKLNHEMPELGKQVLEDEFRLKTQIEYDPLFEQLCKLYSLKHGENAIKYAHVQCHYLNQQMNTFIKSNAANSCDFAEIEKLPNLSKALDFKQIEIVEDLFNQVLAINVKRTLRKMKNEKLRIELVTEIVMSDDTCNLSPEVAEAWDSYLDTNISKVNLADYLQSEAMSSNTRLILLLKNDKAFEKLGDTISGKSENLDPVDQAKLSIESAISKLIASIPSNRIKKQVLHLLGQFSIQPQDFSNLNFDTQTKNLIRQCLEALNKAIMDSGVYTFEEGKTLVTFDRNSFEQNNILVLGSDIDSSISFLVRELKDQASMHNEQITNILETGKIPADLAKSFNLEFPNCFSIICENGIAYDATQNGDLKNIIELFEQIGEEGFKNGDELISRTRNQNHRLRSREIKSIGSTQDLRCNTKFNGANIRLDLHSMRYENNQGRIEFYILAPGEYSTFGQVNKPTLWITYIGRKSEGHEKIF